MLTYASGRKVRAYILGLKPGLHDVFGGWPVSLHAVLNHAIFITEGKNGSPGNDTCDTAA